MEYDIETDYLGDKRYYKKRTNILHREDGPAIESSMYDSWYINGKRHREDGPAVKYSNGDMTWYINGKYHRMDGPAVDWLHSKEWWVDGKRLSPEKEVILNQWWNNKNGI